MKLESIKEIGLSVVSGQVDVIFSTDVSESNELRSALGIVDKYKKAAFTVIKEEKGLNPKESDWHMVSYCVKNNKIIVSIKDGMAG